MNLDKHTQDEIDQTMRSIDSIERATPRPFFVTRAEARLDRLQTLPKPLSWAFRPTTMVLALSLIVLLNLLTVSFFQQYLARPDPAVTADQFTADWQPNNDPLSW
ncbi:MAG: hypothetical protein EAZ91_10865 [Cytophagales bacterium]|nr:MAG: hypothetical protein EAZ91_10865 [Cytophagales bacterium]